MLEKEVSKAKITYAEALRNLEQISDEIHQNRNKNRHNHITEKIHSNKPNESEIIENSGNVLDYYKFIKLLLIN